MGLGIVLEHLRVGWWAGAEAADPLAAMGGSLLRAEMVSRCPWISPVLLFGAPVSWSDPGFTGELAARHFDWAGQQPAPIDVFVASGNPAPAGTKAMVALADRGSVFAAVAPEEGWGLGPGISVGPPFAVPEPVLLAARHLPRTLLEDRGAFLRVVEGLPRHYVLVEGTLLPPSAERPSTDLELALGRLAQAAGGDHPAELVRLTPGPLSNDDASAEELLRQRRAEVEEGRYQPEDWAGDPHRPRLSLLVASPLDLAAAVAGASVVVAQSGALMALAWALGVPHVALGDEDSPASSFAAWTGDASALAQSPADMVATIDNIFARRGRPPGLNRLEATLDQALDEAASNLERSAAEAASRPRQSTEVSLEERLQELTAVNDALRLRLAAERLRFGERSALLEKTAATTVESAIKAVHGQDVIIRRRLEQTEREMHRLQEETAVQQRELREIYATWTMRAIGPARELYGRLRKAAR